MTNKMPEKCPRCGAKAWYHREPIFKSLDSWWEVFFDCGSSVRSDGKEDFKCESNAERIGKLLEEAAEEGIIICPDCGAPLEPDAPECGCGWVNPLLKEGLI